MKKNYFVKTFRIDRESHDIITLIADKTGFEKSKINRWLFNFALEKIKADIIRAKGIDNLQLDIKEIKRINC